jgi:hypothetical protein
MRGAACLIPAGKIIISVSEPHHLIAAPAPGKICYAAPAPSLLFIYQDKKQKLTCMGMAIFFLLVFFCFNLL